MRNIGAKGTTSYAVVSQPIEVCNKDFEESNGLAKLHTNVTRRCQTPGNVKNGRKICKVAQGTPVATCVPIYCETHGPRTTARSALACKAQRP